MFDQILPDGRRAGLGLHARSWWMRAGRGVVLTLRVVPRRHRFAAARMLAHAVEPVVLRTSIYRTWPERLDSVREMALYGVMTLMDRQQVPFDPALRVTGAELLHDELRRGRGLLVLGLHQTLVTLLPRYLHDIGCTPTIVAGTDAFPIFGTGITFPALQSSAGLLIKVRTQLRAGRLVCAMMDAGGREPTPIDTTTGPKHICHSWMRLAHRCQASILFASVHLEPKQIVVSLTRPSYASDASAEDVVDAVVSHVSGQTRRAVSLTAAVSR
jgi:lauroyl/myristoyl acyltransferase